MKVLSALMLPAMLAGCITGPARPPAVTLAFRSGSSVPGPGLTKMTVAGSDRVVYLSEQVVLANADVASALIVPGPSGPQVEITFTGAGAARFARVTAANVGKPLGILVNGQLISAPIVQEAIRGRKAVISGGFSEEEARRIARGIMLR